MQSFINSLVQFDHAIKSNHTANACAVRVNYDRLEVNFNPIGRIFYSASTLICTPASRSQDGAMCLGAQAGETRIREILTKAGFTRFRRATQTPFNLVYEARP